jgi:hypothetical protein
VTSVAITTIVSATKLPMKIFSQRFLSVALLGGGFFCGGGGLILTNSYRLESGGGGFFCGGGGLILANSYRVESGFPSFLISSGSVGVPLLKLRLPSGLTRSMIRTTEQLLVSVVAIGNINIHIVR